MAKVVVLGAGLSGLASAALLAQAGHQVTVLERNSWVGGKSRRIEVLGQRMDTGPALVTYPEVWENFLSTYDSLGAKKAADVIDLKFEKLPEIGRYYLRNHVTYLPVKPEHHWFKPWERFATQHDRLTPAITKLLTLSPFSLKTLAPVGKIAGTYGINLTTSSYINSLDYMPKGLKEVIAIHTLNAGISPKRSLALYASMTASMASQGISVPVGGVNEIAQSIFQLALAAGATVKLNAKVTKVSKGLVEVDGERYQFDQLVSSIDPFVLKQLMGKPKAEPKLSSCSGVAIYAVLKNPLPEEIVTHSVIMPDDSDQLFEAIEAKRPPKQTMTFVNYYRAGHIYPNSKPTVAVLLTAPADGKAHDLNSEWVRQELDRVSEKLGLSSPIDELFEDYQLLNPEYFSVYGAKDGALYGATKPLWQSGPFHAPAHHNPMRPWLWRVGASVHPGGGIPAVLGSAQITTAKLLRKLGKGK
ncbi:NAD(P)/FAD-dependent oxidoreductase [Aquiluna borgnonia]|uniref:4,4'-diaponeurosporene oxygenase n=1 Tax=Aquiluna borgnonia TaxID=2499157 RepID=A0A7D4UIS8_9MICO|nr:NAD(P)/FAD-dependent oxidoreductase [Aquiluna borgnonia]QKJ25820.1 NAD(P)/FAD-dependent oxidoreductase [Aquiluna borgnonia]